MKNEKKLNEAEVLNVLSFIELGEKFFQNYIIMFCI